MKILTKALILGEKLMADATLREALIAQALQGILANPAVIPELVAVDAVAYADAVLEILTAEANEGEEIP